jgi:hypothetical protein
MDELALDCENALMVLAQGHRNDEAATADTTLQRHIHSKARPFKTCQTGLLPIYIITLLCKESSYSGLDYIPLVAGKAVTPVITGSPC